MACGDSRALVKRERRSIVNLQLQTGIETAWLRKQYPDREVSSRRMSNCHCTAAASDLKLACIGLFCALISTRAMHRQQGSGSAPLQPGPLHQSISKKKSCKGLHQQAQQMPWGASFGSVLFLFGSINPAAVIGYNQALAVASAPWVSRTAGLEDGLQEA